jgi:hypothetical protein
MRKAVPAEGKLTVTLITIENNSDGWWDNAAHNLGDINISVS